MPVTKSRRSRDRYMELVSAFPLRPIRTHDAHQQAKGIIRARAREKGQAVADYRAVLVNLVVEYEQKAGHRLDISGVSAADIVRHLLVERGMSVSAFAKSISVPQSTLSEMLNGNRAWSKSTIVAVSGFFGLSADIFLR